MRLSEKILVFLSRKPGSNDYVQPSQNCDFDKALDLLCICFPNFLDDLQGKLVLDFGCGSGFQALALVQSGAQFVIGIDINQKSLERAINMAKEKGVEDRAQFKDSIDEKDRNKFDIVISQNSMEHFKDPINILNEMKTALRKNGKIYITIEPPWFAPYGSHMHFFTKMPWVNLLFSEKAVMKVRSYFRNDGALRYEDVESGLNKMSINKFERIVSDSGLKILYKKYRCIRGLDFLGKVPLLRELIINQVDCILTDASEV